MLSEEQFARLTRQLPRLKMAEPALINELLREAFFAVIPAGREIFTEADRVEAIALLLSGVVRVYKIGETGREITLYRFGTGESCVLSANAILNQQAFSAIALVEDDAEAVMIPAAVLRDWLRRYDSGASLFLACSHSDSALCWKWWMKSLSGAWIFGWQNFC